MTRYQTIVTNENTILALMNKSLMPIHILDWKVYYEAYLQEIENQKKYCYKVRVTEAVETVAANYDITRRQMFKIIAFMESN